MTRLLPALTIVAATFVVPIGAAGRPVPVGAISGTIDLRTFSTTRAPAIPPGSQVEIIVLPRLRHPVAAADLELDVPGDGRTAIDYTIPNITLSDTVPYIVTIVAHPKNFHAANPADDFDANLHIAGKGVDATSFTVKLTAAQPNARANFGARGVQLPASIGAGTITGTIAFIPEAGPVPNAGSEAPALPAAIRVDSASHPIPIGFTYVYVGSVAIAADGTHVAHYTISNLPVGVPLRINVNSTTRPTDPNPSHFINLTRFHPASAQTLGEAFEVTLDATVKHTRVDFVDYALEVPPMPPPPTPIAPTATPVPQPSATPA